MVMATGICAISASQHGVRWLAVTLHAIAAVMYAVLVVLLAWRVTRYPRGVWTDLTSHERGFAFLTVVAATNVLAEGTGIVHARWGVTEVLAVASVPLWCALVYVPLSAAVIGQDKPGMEQGINGTWFLLVVSTESVAAVCGLLLTREGGDLLAFAALGAFALGLVLYVVVMTMVFLRWTFLRVTPDELDPPAWIAAGAVAITALAGSNLLIAADRVPRLAELAPVLEGVVVLAWATSTFWVPLMFVLGFWRHVVRRVPLSYQPSYWAMVFPLGMYAAATYRMRDAIDLDGLGWLPTVALAVALAAWLPTFAGLVHGLVRRRPDASPGPGTPPVAGVT
jgi:tellurite resistance protein TehA-like permease